MRDIFIFAVGASIVGTIFFVSLFELLFTIKRRRVNQEIEQKVKEIKATYNESVNRLVIEEEQKLETVEKEVETAASQVATEKEALQKEYEDKIEHIQETSEKALAAAKAKAKRLEEEAKLQADEYLASRKKEVEQDLMNLVLEVSKKVLPTGITYEVHKELVIKALEDLQSDSAAA